MSKGKRCKTYWFSEICHYCSLRLSSLDGKHWTSTEKSGTLPGPSSKAHANHVHGPHKSGLASGGPGPGFGPWSARARKRKKKLLKKQSASNHSIKLR